MFIFGGVVHGPRLLMNDVWALDMGARKWEEVSVAKDLASPIPREGHSMVAGPENVANSFTIFGGIGYGYTPLDDVWTFDVQSGEWKAMTTGAVDKKRPPARWLHSSVTIDNKMYIFGGCSENYAAMQDTGL